MTLQSIAKNVAKDVVTGVVLTGSMAAAGALTAPLLGVTAGAGAAFVATYMITSKVVDTAASYALNAIGINSNDQPFKAKICGFASFIISGGAALGAAFGVSAAFGLSIGTGTGIGLIVVSSLALAVAGIACTALTGLALLLTVGVGLGLTYLILKVSEKSQQKLCSFLRKHEHFEEADKVWDHFHKGTAKST